MPKGDRTGPMGMGPMTGRGAGYCAGFDTPGCATLTPGRGMGAGRGARGGGRGHRRMFIATGQPGWMRFNAGAQAPAAEMEAAPGALSEIKAELASIMRRLDQMENATGRE